MSIETKEQDTIESTNPLLSSTAKLWADKNALTFKTSQVNLI